MKVVKILHMYIKQETKNCSKMTTMFILGGQFRPYPHIVLSGAKYINFFVFKIGLTLFYAKEEWTSESNKFAVAQFL